MKTITILLDTGPDGKPFRQIAPSDGIAPQDGIQAGWAVVSFFQNLLIDAEVQQRLAELLATDDEPEQDAERDTSEEEAQ